MLSIGIGSKTSTGGVVIEGNEGLLFDGLVASSVGHKAMCPACKKGMGEIVAVGSRAVYLPAGPAARAGDYVACGCPPGSNILVAQGAISIGNNDAAFSASTRPHSKRKEPCLPSRSKVQPGQQIESADYFSSEQKAIALDSTAHPGSVNNLTGDTSQDPVSGTESPAKGEWIRAGEVIGEGRKGTFRLGHKIKIEGADDRASLHINNSAYELTFTEIGSDGALVAGAYPSYKGVLSSGLSNAFSTDRVVELHGPPGTLFDWTLLIVRTPQSCDNCGWPMIIVYEWKSR